MGFPHFTVEGKNFGRDTIRSLIISEKYPIAIINADVLNPIRELQGRLSYLNSVIKKALEEKLKTISPTF